MKKFRFPLRPVAILRSHLELRAREAFAKAVHAYVVAEERLGSIRGHMAELESVLFTDRRDTFDAATAATFFRAYRQECALEIGAEREAIAARVAMQASRAAYLEANRKVKVVARLEDKARAAHRRDADRAEQAELDELASHRATRRRQPLFAS
jgi:flagellar FliJ protein